MIDVLFVQGGGKGAHDADAPLADSLQDALGATHTVHFPRSPMRTNRSVDHGQARSTRSWRVCTARLSSSATPSAARSFSAASRASRSGILRAHCCCSPLRPGMGTSGTSKISSCHRMPIAASPGSRSVLLPLWRRSGCSLRSPGAPRSEVSADKLPPSGRGRAPVRRLHPTRRGRNPKASPVLEVNLVQPNSDVSSACVSSAVRAARTRAHQTPWPPHPARASTRAQGRRQRRAAVALV